MITDDPDPIPPHLVHKRNTAEVLLIGVRAVPDEDALDLFLAPGWCDGVAPGSPEFVLRLAEALRQAVIVTAHVGHGVPLGDAFVMERMRFQGASARTRESTVIRVSAGSRVMRGSRLISMIAEVRFLAAGTTQLTGEGHLRVIPAIVHRRMREGRLLSDEIPAPTPIDRGFTAFPSPEGGMVVVYDARHPLFFDHPVDHVPGMLLIAAALDGFESRFPGFAITRIDARFLDYVDLTESRLIEMRASTGRTALRNLHRTSFGSVARASAVVDVYSASDLPLTMAVEASPSDGVSASMIVE